MALILCLAAGGALGTLARFGLAGWMDAATSARLPLGTLMVNVLGSFLIGLIAGWLEDAAWPPEVRLGVTVGLLGAFTTFSTYSWETVVLLREGAWLRAGGYALGSVALGLAAVVLGIRAGGGLPRPL